MNGKLNTGLKWNEYVSNTTLHNHNEKQRFIIKKGTVIKINGNLISQEQYGVAVPKPFW